MKTPFHPCFFLVVVASTFTAAESVAPAADQVVTYPAPAGEPLSADYEVTADGQKVDVYTARVLDPPFAGKEWDFGGPYSFANFDMAGPRDGADHVAATRCATRSSARSRRWRTSPRKTTTRWS